MKDEGIISLFIAQEGQIVNVTEKKPSLSEMQSHVGGLIEYACITHAEGEERNMFPVPASALGQKRDMVAGLLEVVDVIVNEEGLIQGLPPNAISTFAAYSQGFDCSHPLVGPAIIQVKRKDLDSIEWVGFDWIVERTIPEEGRTIAHKMITEMGALSTISQEFEVVAHGYLVARYGDGGEE